MESTGAEGIGVLVGIGVMAIVGVADVKEGGSAVDDKVVDSTVFSGMLEATIGAVEEAVGAEAMVTTTADSAGGSL